MKGDPSGSSPDQRLQRFASPPVPVSTRDSLNPAFMKFLDTRLRGHDSFARE
jgi:hypothetical protein